MFGGRGGRESRPDFVGDAWSIAAEFLKENKGIVRPIAALLAHALSLGLHAKRHRHCG